MMGSAGTSGVDRALLRGADRALQVRESPYLYDVTCAECSALFQRSRRATRYGFPLVCRVCEVNSE